MGWLYRPRMVQFVAIITGIYMLYYTIWRFTETLNPQYLFFSLLLAVAELQGIINFYLFLMMTWNIRPNYAPIVKRSSATIDVFVPTYNEEVEILEATLLGCKEMRLEHTTYVLDDGRRKEVEELAARLGCRYLTRPDNKDAKAGNINSALKQTTGELIVVLDADMVPQPDFLEKAVGYFRDELVAIVQTPQEFYNIDSIQHTETWHEQELFYRVIQAGKDNIGATFWCGSPSILRRTAIESIGGVATESITEDFQTSIRLNAEGWKIRYHNETLAYGIAAQSLHAFNSQRLRWAQGAMQILRGKDSPLTKKGLSWKQRFSHFSAILTYLDAYQKLVYLIAPILFLAFGWLPLQVEDGWSFLIHWLPYFLLSQLANFCLGRGYFRLVAVEKYNILKMFTFIRASLILIWPKTLNFKVTPKKTDQTVKQKDRVELYYHIMILGFMAVSLIIAVISFISGRFYTNQDYVNLVISLLWLGINGTLLLVSVKDVIMRLYMRQDYRFPLNRPAVVVLPDETGRDITIHDISRKGLGFSFDIPFEDQVDREIPISIRLVEEELELQGVVVFDRKAGDTRRMGIRFKDLPEEMNDKLVKYLFITLPRMIDAENQKKRRHNTVAMAFGRPVQEAI